MNLQIRASTIRLTMTPNRSASLGRESGPPGISSMIQPNASESGRNEKELSATAVVIGIRSAREAASKAFAAKVTTIGCAGFAWATRQK